MRNSVLEIVTTLRPYRILEVSSVTALIKVQSSKSVVHVIYVINISTTDNFKRSIFYQKKSETLQPHNYTTLSIMRDRHIPQT